MWVVLVTKARLGWSAKVAVTVVAAVSETVQVPVPLQPAPDQPVKVDTDASGEVAATALRVTVVLWLNVAAQVAPQAMPAGDESTVPAPSPAGRR